MEERKIRLGISIGDLNGIGAEVVFKTFEDSRMLEFCTPVIFASLKTLNFVKRKLKINCNLFGIANTEAIVPNKINVIDIWTQNVSIEFGKVNTEVGRLAIESFQAATEALKNDEIDVLVTAPINKQSIQSETFKFPGHTDYLNQELEGDSLMFMIDNNLRVGLLTDHVAVKDVASTITAQLITQKVQTVYHSLQMDFAVSKPRIAILGINPHSGDNGVIGKEDEEIMKPTIEEIRKTGKLVFGPYAADSFFGSDNYKSFDAIIAAYHDQGLIPFKTLSFGNGVNYTAGLEKIRTSPDHGTAYEIAGKGEADQNSFKEAVFSALHIFKNRAMYKELTKNPLKRQPRKTFSKERFQ